MGIGGARRRASSLREGVLGVAFVSKKDGSLRIISDTRVLNLDFKEPPSTHLPTATAFGNIEVEGAPDFFSHLST